jgi:hypothetical protein
MNVFPIQVTQKGVLIPREYLSGDQFELVVTKDHVMIRPKADAVEELQPSKSSRFSFVGIATSKNPEASENFEAILQQELGVRPVDSDNE